MELRKHYLLDRWTYIARGRGSRPKEYKTSELFPNIKSCFFCPGHEEKDLEIGRIKKGNSWLIRWIRNKYPSLLLTPEPIRDKNKKPDFFHSKPSYGYQEVIVETPVHTQRFCEFSLKHLVKLFKVYQQRINAIYDMPDINYVSLFKNFGPESGASIVHSHSQLMGIAEIPEKIRNLVKETKKYKKCPFCDIIKQERKSERFIKENDDFIAFAPYSPRFSYEIWIFPKRHLLSFNNFNEKELTNLGKILKFILKKINFSYNFFFMYSPKKSDNLHFHMEIAPRSSKWAGFELETGRYIISVPPEETAKFIRGEL